MSKESFKDIGNIIFFKVTRCMVSMVNIARVFKFANNVSHIPHYKHNNGQLY